MRKEFPDIHAEDVDMKDKDYDNLSLDMKEIVDQEPNVPEGPPHFTVNNTGKEISQPNRYRQGPKRTITEREADLVVIAKLYLAGKNHHEITQELNSIRPYEIKRVQVSHDIYEIYRRWTKSYLSDMNKIKIRELARVDRLEAEYWEAWEESKKDKMGVEQIKTADQMPAGKGEMKTSYQRTKTTTKKEKRDPNFMFLQGIQWCIEERCKILGLNAPQQVNVNWRKQAEEAGIVNPDDFIGKIVDGLVRYSEEQPAGEFLDGSGQGGSLGNSPEEDQTTPQLPEVLSLPD